MSAEPDPTEQDSKAVTARESFWAKWATVAIVGEICLVTLFLVVGGMLKAYDLRTYVAAAVVATFVAGRLGGLRGLAQWLSAAVIIVLVSVALAYVLILAIVSQITGP